MTPGQHAIGFALIAALLFGLSTPAAKLVLAWGAAGVIVALRRFGWMPRER